MNSASRSVPDWKVEGADWPNRDASFFHRANGLNWHVQQMGKDMPQSIVLLHGTGAATHSFRDLMPALAEQLNVLTFDLPGHGFTTGTGPLDLSLDGMTASVAALLKSLPFQPDYLLGHSAGAAIAIQFALQSDNAIKQVFGVNAALSPIKGNAVLSPVAKLLFANPFSSRLFSMTASQSPLGDRLIASAGPDIDQAGRMAYRALMRCPAHVRGAIGMMASWNLTALLKRLPHLKPHLTLIVAADDKLVPASDSKKAVERIPNAELIEFKTGGHLLHEVSSKAIAQVVFDRMAHNPSQTKLAQKKAASS